jgi:DNA modification methylase
VLPLINPDSVDLLIADPPYGFSQSKQLRPTRAAHDIGKSSGLPMVHGDDEPFDPTPLLIFDRKILFGANHYAKLLPETRSWLVWDKRDESEPDNNGDAELIWTDIDGVIRTYRQCWRGVARANDSLEPMKHVHPTQKPVNLMMWLLERYTKPGDLIFDPYMGSGPIAKACQLLGRRYIGVELVETYCATAVKRLQQSVMRLETA